MEQQPNLDLVSCQLPKPLTAHCLSLERFVSKFDFKHVCVRESRFGFREIRVCSIDHHFINILLKRLHGHGGEGASDVPFVSFRLIVCRRLEYLKLKRMLFFLVSPKILARAKKLSQHIIRLLQLAEPATSLCFCHSKSLGTTTPSCTVGTPFHKPPCCSCNWATSFSA